MKSWPAVLVVAIGVGIGAVPCHAQESPRFKACGDRARAQFDLNQCASDDAKRADADLNKAYQALLASVSKDPNAVAKIKAAEKAWVVYRDAYIDAMYPAADKQAEYGTMYPMDLDLLLAKLIREHTQALKDLSQNN